MRLVNVKTNLTLTSYLLTYGGAFIAELTTMPTDLDTPQAFEESIKERKLSVVHFFADWADQCAQINDVLSTLAAQPEYSHVKFYKCPAEDVPEISLKYKVDAVPAILLFRNAKEIDRVNGADPAKLTGKIKQHSEGADIQDEPDQNQLNERLKELINNSKVMLFMKGDRNVPRCGFSRQITQILNDAGVTYQTFDILTDEAVRQGLKVYSDWPTYPQLYVNGELIGGLDIVKEMVASGELEKTLNN